MEQPARYVAPIWWNYECCKFNFASATSMPSHNYQSAHLLSLYGKPPFFFCDLKRSR